MPAPETIDPGSDPTPTAPVPGGPGADPATTARAMRASGTMSPDITAIIFLPAGSSAGKPQWSSDGNPTPPDSGDWWVVRWRQHNVWVVNKYTDGRIVQTFEWTSSEDVDSPDLVNSWTAHDSATGAPSFSLAGVAPSTLDKGSDPTPTAPSLVEPWG